MVDATLTPKLVRDNRSSIRGSIACYSFEWTSATGGTVALSLGNLNGELLAMDTDPGSTAPTADYDITIINEAGVDVLGGAGVDRHTSTSERAYPPGIASAGHGAPMSGGHTLTISGAGDEKGGTVYLYLK